MAESYFGIIGNYHGKTFDALLEFTATGTAVSDGSTSDTVWFGTGFVDADLVLDVGEATTGTNTATLQFSADDAFSSPVDAITATLIPGRQIVPFRTARGNEIPFAYARLKYAVGGNLVVGAFAGMK